MTTVTSRHVPTIWKKLCLPNLKSITEIMKKFKRLYGFGGRCIKIREACMDFEPCFKVHNLVSVHPKSTILGQMTNLNRIFHMVGSVYRLIKIWKSPQFPVEFRNGQLKLRIGCITRCIISWWGRAKKRKKWSGPRRKKRAREGVRTIFSFVPTNREPGRGKGSLVAYSV